MSLEPYYADDTVTLYHGDCLEVLPQISGYDLVVTSPPYNKGKQSGGLANMRDGYDGYGDDLPDAEYVSWQRDVIGALWDGLPDHGAIFYNHKQQVRNGEAWLPLQLIPERVTLRQIIVWNRQLGVNWAPGFYQPRHEWILLLARSGFMLASKSESHAGDVWNIRPDLGNNEHPCPFPQGIPNTAISTTTAKVVLDPFAGSGTTLRSAVDLGRKAIGIEKSERYCELIVQRLAQGVLL